MHGGILPWANYDMIGFRQVYSDLSRWEPIGNRANNRTIVDSIQQAAGANIQEIIMR